MQELVVDSWFLLTYGFEGLLWLCELGVDRIHRPATLSVMIFMSIATGSV